MSQLPTLPFVLKSNIQAVRVLKYHEEQAAAFNDIKRHVSVQLLNRYPAHKPEHLITSE
jgi:hypothetical protein